MNPSFPDPSLPPPSGRMGAALLGLLLVGCVILALLPPGEAARAVPARVSPAARGAPAKAEVRAAGFTFSGATGRRRVVQIAALGMALALFIILRAAKH